jgi:transcription antitermination factor NusG
MKWSLHDEIPATGGVAAFGRATLPGRVFIEAPSLEDAKRMIANVPHLTPNKAKPVPGDDYPSCLTEGNTYTPLIHHWVRLRRPRLYKGDVALITRVDERSLLIGVSVVPRLNFTDNKNISRRPPQKLVNPFEVERLLGPGSVSFRNWQFILMDAKHRGQLFCDSGHLLLRDLDTNAYIPAEAMPTITELEMFKPSRDDVPEEALTKTRDRIIMESLQLGDQVKILSGEYQGLLGEVEAIDGLEVQVAIPTQGVTQGILMPYLRRNYQIGDEVRIVTGPNAGFIGWVTAVEPGNEGDPKMCVINTSKEKEVMSFWVERYLLFVAHLIVQIRASCSSAKFYSSSFVWTTLRPIRPTNRKHAIVKTMNKKRKADPDEGRAVRINDNPNRRYEGKQVVVVHGSFKGYHGKIKSTTPQGDAQVELDATAVSKMKVERFPLVHLRIL